MLTRALADNFQIGIGPTEETGFRWGDLADVATQETSEPERELADDLYGLVTYLGAAGHRELLHAIAREELSYSQIVLLDELAEGRRPTIREAAMMMHLAPHSGSRIVAQLARRGLVRREEDDGSYRTKRVVITDRGRRALDRLHAARRDAIEAFSQQLEPAKRSQLQTAIRSCVDREHLAAHEPPPVAA